MNIKEQLGLINPFKNKEHETLLEIVTTGDMLLKSAHRILEPFGITEAQFNILMLLRYQSRDGRLIQSELGKMLLVNRSNVTGLIDRMEKTGFVCRASDNLDRRANIIEMTEKGEAVFELAREAYYGAIEKAMSSVTADDRERLVETLGKIREELEKT